MNLELPDKLAVAAQPNTGSAVVFARELSVDPRRWCGFQSTDGSRREQ